MHHFFLILVQGGEGRMRIKITVCFCITPYCFCFCRWAICCCLLIIKWLNHCGVFFTARPIYSEYVATFIPRRRQSRRLACSEMSPKSFGCRNQPAVSSKTSVALRDELTNAVATPRRRAESCLCAPKMVLLLDERANGCCRLSAS